MLKSFILTLCFAALLPAQVSDAFGYTANADAFAYSDISSSGVSLLANSDDASTTINLPFAFRFYGVSQSSVCVSTNGLLSFGGCLAGDFSNFDLTAFAPNPDLPLIAPLWQDLTFLNGNAVFYQTLGSAPNRRFIIQWHNAQILNTPGTLNFQVELRESSNQIVFRYLSTTVTDGKFSSGGAASVGIRNTLSLTTNHRLQWSYASPVIASSSAILFTPPTVAAPVNVTSSVRISSTGLTLNRITRRYTTTFTITNTSAQPLARPLSLVISNLSANGGAFNPSGTLPGVGPYYVLPGTQALAPGQSININLEFTSSTTAPPTYTPLVYSGNL